MSHLTAFDEMILPHFPAAFNVNENFSKFLRISLDSHVTVWYNHHVINFDVHIGT